MAGTAGGRQVRVRSGPGVRPTPLRVREALFSILGDQCVGSRVLDACAGTGALGLEALSRGAASVCFVEKSAHVAATLRENLDRIGLAGARVVHGDVLRVIPRLGREGCRFDLVFVDQPYDLGLAGPIAGALVGHGVLASQALVVIEHPPGELPMSEGLRLVDQRRYGNVALAFFDAHEGA